MPPFNPFLRAFFRSALPSQCQPISSHVLLVPTTEILLFSKDTETNLAYSESCLNEEFLSSHVLHVDHPALGASGREASYAAGNAREIKAKPKQYVTINGKIVVIRDNIVYSNRGYRTLNQAQLLHDVLYYPDALDGQQWLVYYISRPLVGTFQPIPIIPAVISDEPSRERRKLLAEASGESAKASEPPPVPRKKEIKNFGDLLMQFPMISRQMQGGLERLIREFVAAHDTAVSKRSSRRSSISSQRSGPSISESVSSLRSSLSGSSTIHPTAVELETDEESMRTGLETAVTGAIDLFQSVDKVQLSMLGTNTELTGPVVERMLERYVMEQVHNQTVFPRICSIRSQEDADLESRLRKMSDVDIAQVGIPIDDGMAGKRKLAARLEKGIGVFKKMGASSSPQEMLEVLLATQKAITSADEQTEAGEEGEENAPTNLTIDADLLVSMLLVVVIRSGIRHLHAKMVYMRYFIFIDEVETGEQGYALATLEAVLMHLSLDSRALRRASKKNRALWQAARSGDIQALKTMLMVPTLSMSDAPLSHSPIEEDDESSDANDVPMDTSDREEDVPGPEEEEADASHDVQHGEFAAVNGSLEHVFPFKKPPTPPPEQTMAKPAKAKKHVSMAPRSQSQSSNYSTRSHSRTQSIDSVTSLGPGGDVSVPKIAQTQDADGNSVLMMSVEAGKADSLRFLLSIPAHFRLEFVLDDINNERVTLLSAAVQSDNRAVTDALISYLEANATPQQLRRYFAMQDSKGRCVAHYLFTQPHLITRFGKKLPWKLKDKNGQSPLFALCRSYDHEQYRSMVESALILATEAQDDGEPLHLDDHVDLKGNTLLHIVNEPTITAKLLHQSDSDVNAANDKRFTPLMVGSKYGRVDLVRALFGDPRADITLRDLRGLSAMELAKDDDVRNRIDDLVLLSAPAGKDGRTTTIVRSFFMEDSTVRLVLKSCVRNSDGSITVTTCRRSVADFQNLVRWLCIECPASWLPSDFGLASPFLIPSRPSRAILRDTQLRLDAVFRTMLTHATFATHELVWEFFLVPELDADMLYDRSRRKAEARVDNSRDDYEPVTDVQEVESFVAYSRDQVRGVALVTKKLLRSVNRQRMRQSDLAESAALSASALTTVKFLPPTHLTAFERYTRTLSVSDGAPLNALYYTFRCTLTSAQALQSALNRPAYLIGSMAQAERAISRSQSGLVRANRWTPNIALFDDTKRAAAADALEKEVKARRELESLGCELRYTMVTVASELAGWQEQRAQEGRTGLKQFARAMVVREKARLEGMKRALREARKGGFTVRPASD